MLAWLNDASLHVLTALVAYGGPCFECVCNFACFCAPVFPDC